MKQRRLLRPKPLLFRGPLIGSRRLPLKKLWLSERLWDRGIVFSHRDIDIILDKHEKKGLFSIYTGHGPGRVAGRISYMIPFELTKWLSDAIEVPLIVVLTDVIN